MPFDLWHREIYPNTGQLHLCTKHKKARRTCRREVFVSPLITPYLCAGIDGPPRLMSTRRVWRSPGRGQSTLYGADLVFDPPVLSVSLRSSRLLPALARKLVSSLTTTRLGRERHLESLATRRHKGLVEKSVRNRWGLVKNRE